MNFVGRQDLNILNLDIRCSGEITRRQNDNISTIDYVLANENLYKIFNKMLIDENNEIIDFSDHNIMITELRYGRDNNFKLFFSFLV